MTIEPSTLRALWAPYTGDLDPRDVTAMIRLVEVAETIDRIARTHSDVELFPDGGPPDRDRFTDDGDPADTPQAVTVPARLVCHVCATGPFASNAELRRHCDTCDITPL